MVAVDEMHVVEQWATFREQYGQLSKLRARIPSTIPWFGTSATLDRDTLRKAMRTAGFDNPRILRTTVDRPDIFYEVRSFEVEPST
jgi:superfamily II DNA helicase RecQ